MTPANLVQADLGPLPAMGPMSAQQYEVLLDPNYIADQQQESGIDATNRAALRGADSWPTDVAQIGTDSSSE